MTTNALPNGIGETQGDTLATCKPVILSGSVRYVHSGTGDDSGGNDGLDKEAPLATLVAAIDVAQDYDWIVLLSGHDETLTEPLEILLEGIQIIGAGAVRPLIRTHTPSSGVSLLGYFIHIRGVDFPAATAPNAGAKVFISGDHCRMTDCTLTMGAEDSFALENGADADGTVLTDLVFDGEEGALASLRISSGSTIRIDGLTMDDTTMDIVASYVFAEGVRLVSGGKIAADAIWTGAIQVSEQSADSQVEFQGSIKTYTSGLGQPPGDPFAAEGIVYTTMTVFYLHHTGDDANTGFSENRPKATLDGVITDIGEASIIVAMDGHTETLTGATALGAGYGVILVGGGQSGGQPSVEFTVNTTWDEVISLAHGNSQLRNVTLLNPEQVNE